jgi:hypothetical protein
MNTYEKKAAKDKTNNWLQSIEGQASDRKLKMKDRALKGTGHALLKGALALGGGFAGAAMGRWSLLTGFVATGVGEVLGSPEAVAFGVGMIASNVVAVADGVSGTDDGKSTFQKAKDRMKNYGDGIMQKLWLDKLVKKKTTTSETQTSAATTTETGTNGMGEVKYYTHQQGETSDMDMRELEKYEQEIKNSGESFSQGTSGVGDDDNLLGLDDEKIY